MVDIRDPLWQFVGVVFSLAAVCVAIGIYYLQRPRRALWLQIRGNVPLITVNEEALGELELLYQGERVKNTRVVVFRFICGGNTAITPSDYEGPISVEFGAETRVLSAVITERKPENLGMDLGISGSAVEFGRRLLNPGDEFRCRVLVSGSNGPIHVGCRIAGIRDVGDLARRAWGWRLAYGVSLVLVVVAAYFAANGPAWARMGAVVCGLIAVAGGLLALVRDISLPREAPRLCRGGSRSLTFPEVAVVVAAIASRQ